MVRDSRVKTYSFVKSISATSTESFYSDHPINGEILETRWVYGSQGGTGSLWLTFSGTGEIFWTRQTASGAGTQIARPYVWSQNNAGSIAGASLVPHVCNDTLVLNTGSALSGTTAVQVDVIYR